MQAARAPLAACLAATAVLGTLEAFKACHAYLGPRLPTCAQTLALSLAGFFDSFAPNCLFFCALALLTCAPRESVRAARCVLLLGVVASAAVVGCAFYTLSRYPVFGAYLPARAAFGVLFVFVAWLSAAALQPPDHRRGERARLSGYAPGLLALAAALASPGIDARIDPALYLSAHVTVSQVAHLLLGLALWQLSSRVGPAPRWLRLGGWSTAGVLFVPSIILAQTSALDAARPLYLSLSMPGRAKGLFTPYSPAREVAPGPLLDDPDALEHFRSLSRLPELPADFDLREYSVLWLMSEATRFDQTSLGDRALRTTPHLAGLAAAGSFQFTRAFSPSSYTFLTTSALLGMSYPSMLEIDTWARAWNGSLRSGALTAPQLFEASGHDTFWVGHDFLHSFSKGMLGLASRFRHTRLIDGLDIWEKGIDRSIADAALDLLRSRAAANTPFFGVVFFVSPHAPYLAQHAKRREYTELERYRLELREVDQQVGRLLHAVFTSSLASRTIVIFTADHGEEFEEHGGRYHATVYKEALHVPLLIYLPGVQGRIIDAPTSTLYVLPWLLSRAPPDVRRVLASHLGRTLGPMLQATGGAVISEIVGHEVVKTALNYPEHSIVYDFVSDRHEAFRDPAQAADLFGVDMALTEVARRQAQAYRRVRAARHRFTAHPQLLPAPD